MVDTQYVTDTDEGETYRLKKCQRDFNCYVLVPVNSPYDLSAIPEEHHLEPSEVRERLKKGELVRGKKDL